MFAFAVLLSFPNLLLSARYLVQPIVRLTEATKRIAQGQYDLELPTNRKDEVGLLASHFQKMSLELERSDQMKKNLSLMCLMKFIRRLRQSKDMLTPY